jgi:F-type H+-transporting ATPase subunit delta
MDPVLRGYTIAVLQNAESNPSSGGASAVARDLRQISDVTAKTPNLAQVITEQTISGSARRAVARDLFSGRVTEAAARLVDKSIALERADELLSVLIEVADTAVDFANLGWQEFEAEETILGRSGARKLAGGYASCVFEDVAEVSELERIEEDLFAFARVIRENEALRSALADSSRPVGDRRELVSTLLQDKASPVTIRLARAAVLGRSRDPSGSIEWMAERAAEARGWRIARVTSARDLDQQERSDLARALQELAGNPVELLVTQDPELLGGAVVALGNVLVDASAQHRLDQLHEQLLGQDRLFHDVPRTASSF